MIFLNLSQKYIVIKKDNNKLSPVPLTLGEALASLLGYKIDLNNSQFLIPFIEIDDINHDFIVTNL
jgi:hypothetical protein